MSEYYDTIVLSGGSIKTISMLGALQYCYDNGLIHDVKNYIGTSAGGIICYLLVIGYTPLELIAYLCTKNVFKDIHLNIVSMLEGEGAIDFSIFQSHLERMTIEKIGRLVTFKDIKEMFDKSITLTVYNYTQQHVEYLSWENNPDMPCMVALHMTSSIPLIFTPFKYMNNYYIDGGIYDNFPITHNGEHSSRRLGITIDFTNIETEQNPTKDMLDYVYKLFTISLERQSMEIKLQLVKNADIIRISVDVNMLNYKLNAKEKMELFSVGYGTAHDFFKS